MNIEDTATKRAWYRCHRPEEYAADAAKWLAGEIRVPYLFVSPFVPLVKSMLGNWEPAAEEFTVYYSLPGGTQKLRTFFNITNYSNNKIYGTMESILRRLGVGAEKLKRNPEVDFAWVLLGGVLGDYACRAGISSDSIRKLLDFRLVNSDYLTATTWHTEHVEIVNLATAKVDTLSLPADDIRKVVDWSVRYHENACGTCSMELSESCEQYEELNRLSVKYRDIVC